jgi:hypothetical protein
VIAASGGPNTNYISSFFEILTGKENKVTLNAFTTRLKSEKKISQKEIGDEIKYDNDVKDALKAFCTDIGNVEIINQELSSIFNPPNYAEVFEREFGGFFLKIQPAGAVPPQASPQASAQASPQASAQASPQASAQASPQASAQASPQVSAQPPPQALSGIDDPDLPKKLGDFFTEKKSTISLIKANVQLPLLSKLITKVQNIQTDPANKQTYYDEIRDIIIGDKVKFEKELETSRQFDGGFGFIAKTIEDMMSFFFQGGSGRRRVTPNKYRQY